VPSISRGRRCSPRLATITSPRLPHLKRRVPAPRHNHHPCEAPHDETSTRVQAIHPSGLPLTCDPRMEREPLGFPPSSTPRPCGRRTSGRGQATEHGPETTLYVIDLASNLASFTRNVRPRVALVGAAAAYMTSPGSRPALLGGRGNSRSSTLAVVDRGVRAYAGARHRQARERCSSSSVAQ
jgi:hypothetical protein